MTFSKIISNDLMNNAIKYCGQIPSLMRLFLDLQINIHLRKPMLE